MRVPLSWLSDYIDLPESVDDLRDLLTFSGLEVEDVHQHGSDFDGVLTAEITAVRPHPNADKLSLCVVDIGADEPMEVVCGALNAREGLKTIYAPVGVTLPNGLKLKKAKIRGVTSLGMLCAEDELGLSEDHTGIMELPGDTRPGQPAVEVLGGPETVFELEVTPNRPDCLSLIGVARELAALTGRELRVPDVPELTPAGHEVCDVRIENESGCPRYTARLLDGAKVGPAPEWMRKRLRLCGVRPINNLVDITNYVMLETGQPLHAFDRSLLGGDAIRVRNATEGEILRTLDDQDHALSAEDLVIADPEGPVALAGVMGGDRGEIRDATRRVLLESAAFDATLVRHTAKRRRTHTESSYRFSRGCDIDNVEWAGRRAAALMIDHAGASPAGPVADAYPRPPEPVRLACRWASITSLIGVHIPPERMREYFHRLGLEVLDADGEGCEVRIPGFRPDLTRPVDLTEEIARLHGLDQIPVRAPNARVVPDANDHDVRVEMDLCRLFARRGWMEAAHYSLTSPAARSGLDETPAVDLPNPISRDQSQLRPSLLPQMVDTLAFNRAHQADAAALFECGTVFTPGDPGVNEARHICLGTFGPWKRPPLDRQRPVAAAEAFADLKGEVEVALSRLRCLDRIRFRAADHPAFAPGQSAEILLGDTPVGHIGLLTPAALRERKLPGPVALAEFHLAPLIPAPGPSRGMIPIPAFPSITRDVALIVDRSLTHRDVMDVVERARPRDLESVQVFDVFESDKLGHNRKSMAYRFTYRNLKKTLTDKAVEKMHERIVQSLVDALNAEIVGREV